MLGQHQSVVLISIIPVYALSLSLQLSVKTRSVGTNTQEAEKALESSYMEPCQPGTSVNLEGIVWHETEEGESFFTLCTEICHHITNGLVLLDP